MGETIVNENQQKKVLTREKAIEVLNDGGEHKFFFSIDGDTPVYVVGEAREEQLFPRIHEEVIEDMVELKIIPNIEKIRAGYCKVEKLKGEEKLFYWGETSFPFAVTNDKKFNEMVDKNGIVIIDQWLSSKP